MKKIIFGLLLLIAPGSDLQAQTSFSRVKPHASSSDFHPGALMIYGRV
jgi:hypothetical protein